MSQRTAASNNELPGFCGRRGVLETWTEGGDAAANAAGRAYVGQRFMALTAEVHHVRLTEIVLVRGMFPDGKRLWMHLWDVRFFTEDELQGVA